MSCPDAKKHPESCGCCEAEVPEPDRFNPPGLPEISYRVGTHPLFLQRMLSEIHRWRTPDGSHPRPLRNLTSRASDDPAIALMDAWAVVADVLTFYQERIANEGFLRTAAERRSVLELARAIGYELDPGVAAETFLVFTVDDAEGAPTESPVPLGTQVQSIPAGSDELPQTFETKEEFTARRAWNKITPLIEHPQELKSNATRVYLSGTAANLRAGDVVLIQAGGSRHPKRIFRVSEDAAEKRTRIDFTSVPSDPPIASKWPSAKGTIDPDQKKLKLTRQDAETQVFKRKWTEEDLQDFIALNEWDEESLLAYLSDIREDLFESTQEPFLAFRDKVGFFGNNAPLFKSLPEDVRKVASETNKAFLHDWDANGWEIWKNSITNKNYSEADGADVFLEREISGLSETGWTVFKRPGAAYEVFQIKGVVEGSKSGFSISAKVTGLSLANASGSSLTTKNASYKVRQTAAYVRGESLELARLRQTAPVSAGTKTITLSEMVLGLSKGQRVAWTGEEVDSDGFKRTEILELDKIEHGAGCTKLFFKKGLAHSYVRKSVQINANLVGANHGESVHNEALGSGNGSMANQRFELKKPPLTYVSASTGGGSESTLSVRVDGVLWKQERSLYALAPNAKSYVARIDNDGVASVIFGDGKSGARLPTGLENITATYRSGTGLAGEVGPKSLTLLKTRPFGVREVVNPHKASGADDPEKLDDARQNAPLTVLTLDRIVSLQDYEDFARAYSGIGKAQAVTVWKGNAEVVHITVADADGDPVVSPLYDNLLTEIQLVRDPLRAVELDSYSPFFFRVKARVLIDEAYLWEDVQAKLKEALLEAFSFEKRDFGQAVSAAEVVQTMHEIKGVKAVDLDEFFKTKTLAAPPSGNPLSSILTASTAKYDKADKRILPAELLLISEYSLELSEMTP